MVLCKKKSLLNPQVEIHLIIILHELYDYVSTVVEWDLPRRPCKIQWGQHYVTYGHIYFYI